MIVSNLSFSYFGSELRCKIDIPDNTVQLEKELTWYIRNDADLYIRHNAADSQGSLCAGWSPLCVREMFSPLR